MPFTISTLRAVRSHFRSFVRLFTYHQCRPRFLNLQYHPGCDWAQNETIRVCFCSLSYSRPNCHSSVVPAWLADLEEQLTDPLVAYKQVTKHLVFLPKTNDRWLGSFPIFSYYRTQQTAQINLSINTCSIVSSATLGKVILVFRDSISPTDLTSRSIGEYAPYTGNLLIY